MARIPLRTYNREIENLIDRGQIEEAISHAKNILKQYPKHIETYRLLGKAFLESQRYSEASDILQRVLSVIPDDFVSQLGVSIIREDEGNLDAAIWHMERAYEVQPFNRAVQDELRRLYGRRDGLEPPRVRLTRGSLVRMYAKGELYPQAIAETRAALAEDPQRLDLQVLLARTYYLTGQKVEAAEISSSLIGKMPYCMEANRILMDILPETSRAEEAKSFQRRVYDLDPYAEFISPNAPTSAQVPDQSVMVERVDWQPAMQDNQSPDWARSIGVKWETQKEEDLPEWLNAVGGAVVGQTLSQNQTETQTTDEVVPDFMRSAGWNQTNQAVDNLPSPAETVDEEETDLASADIPDWLQSMAPRLPVQETGDDSRLNWLDEILPTAGGVALVGGAAIAASQQEEEAGTIDSLTEGAPPLEEKQQTVDDELPEWMTGTVGPISESEAPSAVTAPNAEDEMPDWLRELTAPEGETALANIPLPAMELASGADLAAEGVETTQPIDELPAWLRSENQIFAENQNAAGTENYQLDQNPVQETEGAAPIDSSSWFQEPSPIFEATSPDEIPEWLRETPVVDDGEMKPPDWLTGSEDEEIPQIVEEKPIIAAQDMTWLSKEGPAMPDLETPLDGEEIPTFLNPEPMISTESTSIFGETPEISTEETDIPEAMIATPDAIPDPNDMDAAMAWLEGLAAKQGADEDSLKISTPEERTETPPAWIAGLAAAGLATAALAAAEDDKEEAPPVETIDDEIRNINDQVVPPAEDELPDWLRIMEPLPGATPEAGLIEESPAEELTTQFTEPDQEITEVASTDMPEWITREASIQEDTFVDTAEPVITQAEKPADTNLDDMDSALAWLEGLAAKQGAEEDTLTISKPEDRSETPPEWVAEQTAEDGGDVGTMSQSVEDTQPIKVKQPEIENIETSWLDQSASIQELKAKAEPVNELPAWLVGLGDENPSAEIPPEQTLPIEELETIPTEDHFETQETADWINESDLDKMPAVGALPAEEPTTMASQAPAQDLNEIDAAMAWLESLAAKQGADEDSLKIVAPEERTETPPAWITEMAAQENAAESFEPIVPESPVELTDTHVGEVDAGIVSPEPLEVEIQQAIEATHPLGSETAAEPEIPDWLLNYEEEQQRKSETWQALVEPATPDQAIPSSADENVSIWLQRHHPEQGTGPLEPPASKEDEAPAWIPEPVVDEVAPAPIGSPLAEAQSAMQQGEIDKAVDLYSSLVESGDHIDETIHDLHEALYRHPVDVGIWQALGDAYIRADKIQEALDAYTKAEELLR